MGVTWGCKELVGGFGGLWGCIGLSTRCKRVSWGGVEVAWGLHEDIMEGVLGHPQIMGVLGVALGRSRGVAAPAQTIFQQHQ